MIGIKKLEVSLRFENKELEVGELVMSDRKIHFKFHQNHIDSGLELSPLKLALKKGIFTAEHEPFEGLFGVFSDSLPDGWGRLLLDRKLISQGINSKQINQLDRLAYVGNSGMGALCYKPIHESKSKIDLNLNLDQLYNESIQILDGNDSRLLNDLYLIGGTSGGARPKINVKYNPITKQLQYGKNDFDEGYENWLIKFASKEDFKDIAQIEFAYYLMAIDAGLEMETSQLFTGQSGHHYFGTKRFDHQHNKRLHMHSAAGLLHDNFRFSTLDYGHLMDVTFKLEKHTNAYKKILRVAAFNVYTHNRDDHSKNFSFLMNEKGEWYFAPVYDITFSNSSHGMHSTLVAGEGENPTKKQLLELAQVFDIPDAHEIIDQVETTVKNWKLYASNAGVTKQSSRIIQNALKLK